MTTEMIAVLAHRGVSTVGSPGGSVRVVAYARMTLVGGEATGVAC
jgi:hypothetical protein